MADLPVSYSLPPRNADTQHFQTMANRSSLKHHFFLSSPNRPPQFFNTMSTASIRRPDTTRIQPAAKLQPKEHGAYAILGIPITTALLVAAPNTAGVCIAIAAIAGFLAHEPLLIAVGRRGTRAQRTTPAAAKRLSILLGLTIACGGAAFAIGSPNVQGALLLCGALATVSFALALLGKHKTILGQLGGVIGLTAPSVPILLAGGVTPAVTAEIWTAWLIGFSATTMAVRGVIAAQKKNSRVIHWTSVITFTLLATALATSNFGPLMAVFPMLLMAWYLMFDPPHAKQLKRVGWALVAGTITSAIWIVVTV